MKLVCVSLDSMNFMTTKADDCLTQLGTRQSAYNYEIKVGGGGGQRFRANSDLCDGRKVETHNTHNVHCIHGGIGPIFGRPSLIPSLGPADIFYPVLHLRSVKFLVRSYSDRAYLIVFAMCCRCLR